MNGGRPVLVVGATSRLGRAAIELLRARGHPVRGMTRQKEGPQADALGRLGVEVVAGDLLDPPSLERACRGAGCVVASAHSLFGFGRSSPANVDGLGHRALIDAARSAGIERFVQVSARPAAADCPVDFFRVKHETEVALRRSGLDFTILRPTAFMETWLDLLAPQVEKGRVVFLGAADNPTNLVSVRDVAERLVQTVVGAGEIGSSLDIGGPENLTMNQVVDAMAAAHGHSVKRIIVPLPVVRLVRLVVGAFHPVARRMLGLAVWSATSDARFDAGLSLDLLGRAPTTFAQLCRERFASEPLRSSPAPRG